MRRVLILLVVLLSGCTSSRLAREEPVPTPSGPSAAYGADEWDED